MRRLFCCDLDACVRPTLATNAKTSRSPSVSSRCAGHRLRSC